MKQTKNRQTDKFQIEQPKDLGKPQMKWGSDVVAEVTRRLDLKYIALVPGASYRGFHDSIVNYLGNSNPQMVICLHEEHAVSIADGYGKVTETPMAVALHADVYLWRQRPSGCPSAPALDRLDSHVEGSGFDDSQLHKIR